MNKPADPIRSSAEPWIAYVGPFRFPWGQPGSRRVYGIAKSLVAAGRRVVVASGERSSGIEILEREGSGELWHVGTGEINGPGASRLRKSVRLLATQGRRTVSWLDAQPTRPSHVIAYGAYAPFMGRLLRWCRREHVCLVADAVEWYEGSHQPLGRWGPFNASTSLALRHLYPRCDGIIAISSYLDRYFAGRGVATMRIPPTLDVAAARTRNLECHEEVVRLLYAGTPGKKDLLGAVIEAVRVVDTAGARVRLDILGVTPREAARMIRGDLPAGVVVRGRVEQPCVVEAYMRSDFSVLLRAPLRYAHAGFPTKVVESLAAGVPVICNLTSDVGEYVHDGIEGFHVSAPTPGALALAISRAVEATAARRAEMRRAARNAAQRHFDYRHYAERLDEFLGALQR